MEQISAADVGLLTEDELIAVEARDRWLTNARPKQIPPPGNWDTVLWLAGRFFGKTRTLTEVAWWECFRVPGLIWHALAPTKGDVRRVTFEGPAGFLSVVPPQLIARYNRSPDHELVFRNGSKVLGFGMVEEADRLRGPQCHALSFDEMCAADRPAGNLEMAYKVASLGVRLKYPDGTPSRKYLATTPRPIPFLKQLIRQSSTVVIKGSSHENLSNVAASVRNDLLRMEGTKFGRQEIYAEILDSDETSIFKRSWIRLWPAGKKLPEFMFTLMSMDTAFEEENIDPKGQKEPDYSACSVWGVFNLRQCFTDKELREFGVKQKYAAVLCDFWMERYAFPDLLEAARKSFRIKYGSPGKVPDLVLIENKASGISLRQTLLTYGVPTWPFNPRGQSKTMRAHAASPLVLQGMMFMPESRLDERAGQVCDWAEPLLDQMTTFSGEGSIEFDDGLDTAVQAMLHLSEKGYFHAEPQGRQYPDADEKEEREQKEAQRIASRSRHKENPYGA